MSNERSLYRCAVTSYAKMTPDGISGGSAYPEAMKPLSCGKENNGGYKVLISSRVGGPSAAMEWFMPLPSTW